MQGFEGAPPIDLLGAGLVLGIAAAILLLFMAPTAGIITWVERRVAGRMQSRIGPNRAGPQGFLVWLADGVKSILKEDIIPTESDQWLFRLAPYLVFMGVSATLLHRWDRGRGLARRALVCAGGERSCQLGSHSAAGRKARRLQSKRQTPLCRGLP
jgi:hypothetical protein